MMQLWIHCSRLGVLAAGLVALAVPEVMAAPSNDLIMALAKLASQDAGVVVSAKFTAIDIDPLRDNGGGRQPLDGTQIGLGANLNGGKWVWGAGWHWGIPYVPAKWESSNLNRADLSEEKTALGISLASTASYSKPTRLRITADLVVSHNGGGLGFWSVMPERDDHATSLTHFTGLNLKPNGDLQVIEDGIEVGSPVHTDGIANDKFNNLAYDVDTTTGAISNVVFNTKPVPGLASAAFKDSATAFGGVLSAGGGRASFNNFKVSSVPE